MLIILGLMIAAMWFWKTTMEGSNQPPVAYSQLYDWVRAGKVESITLAGDVAEATLKEPEKVDGRDVKAPRTYLPQNDEAFLPLLRDKGVKISVKSQQQPFAVQVVMTLLPWALIIGAWVWMSRKARGMLGAGGPLAGFWAQPQSQVRQDHLGQRHLRGRRGVEGGQATTCRRSSSS